MGPSVIKVKQWLANNSDQLSTSIYNNNDDLI